MNAGTREKLKRLCDGCGDNIVFDYPLKRHSTISIGGKAAAWYVPSSPEGLRRAVYFLNGAGEDFMAIGKGSNMLIPDSGLNAVVISLSSPFFRKIDIKGRVVFAGAGVKLSELISGCCRAGLSGFEGLVGIPGTVAGALITNASYRTSISERLERALVLDVSGRLRWIEKKDIQFGYRRSALGKKDIVLQAVFLLDGCEPAAARNNLKDYFREKMRVQPLDKKTLGCIFKNPSRSGYTAGQLIDMTGLKSSRYGAALVSDKHANFIVNDGGASCADVVALMGHIKKKVREKFSIELEPEIEIL